MVVDLNGLFITLKTAREIKKGAFQSGEKDYKFNKMSIDTGLDTWKYKEQWKEECEKYSKNKVRYAQTRLFFDKNGQ